MFYKFNPMSKQKWTCRAKEVQITWYNMACNDSYNCFDEMFKDIETPFKDILAYAETEEDRNKSIRTRIFVNMNNGDSYELIMRKCESDCSNFNDK